MREKLKKIQDILVIAISLEIVIIASILLFNQGIIGYLWDVVKVNLVAGMFYGWAWIMESYFDRDEDAAKKPKEKKPEKTKPVVKKKEEVK